jgi:DHA1 family tetracycline resistance protein-like MFS transporter
MLHYFLFGLSLSLFPLFMIFSAPLLGKLSDQFGRRKLLIICASLNILCYSILAYSVICQNLILFLLGRCLAGCVAGNQPIAQAALVDVSKSNIIKFKNLSLVNIAGSVGVIIGPILGGLAAARDLLERFGYSLPFIISALMSLVNVVLLTIFFYEAKKTKHMVSKRVFSNPIKLILSAISHEKTRYLALVLFLGQLCWGLFFQSLILRLSIEYHFGPAQLGCFLVYIGICISIGGMFIGNFLIKKISVNKLAILSLAILFISSLSSGLITQAFLQWVPVLFGSICAVIFNTSLMHLFTETVEDGSTGLILGVTTAIIYSASIISGLLSGLSNYVSYSFGPLLAATLAFMGLIFSLSLMKGSRRRRFYRVYDTSR